MVEQAHLQYQLQVLEMQRQQTLSQLEEVKETLNKLSDAKGKVYQFHGMLIMETDKDTAQQELESLVSSLEDRLKAIELQLERVKKKLKDKED